MLFRSVIVWLILTAVWALRLCGYITWRNWGDSEDHRYQAIRARNQPNFEWKSLYLVFVLQAVLAWIVSLSLLAAIGNLSWAGYTVDQKQLEEKTGLKLLPLPAKP